MRKIKPSLPELLLACLLAVLTRQAPTLCTVYCPTNACDVSNNYDSCQSCDLKLVLNASMVPNCQPEVAAGYVFEADSRTGGLTYSYSGGSAFGTCGSITNFYTLDTTITITYSGITRNYQKPMMMVGVLLMGSSFVSGCFIDLRFTNVPTTDSMAVSSAGRLLAGTCGGTTERYYRFKETYPSYSTQNTPLIWTVKLSGYVGSSGDAKWGIT